MEQDLSPKSGLLLAAIVLIGSDGEFSDREQIEILHLAELCGDDENETHFGIAIDYYGKHTREECIVAATRSLDEDQRRTALANLIDFLTSEGEWADEEWAVVSAFIQSFRLPDEDVDKIVEVIKWKNWRGIF